MAIIAFSDVIPAGKTAVVALSIAFKFIEGKPDNEKVHSFGPEKKGQGMVKYLV